MLTTRTFKPNNAVTTKIHVLHETCTRRCVGFLVSLCGKQFPRTVEPIETKATCPSCLKFDNPFALSMAQTVKVARLAEERSVNVTDDLAKRDIIDPATGSLTARGDVLLRDMTHTPPWPGNDGVVHGRNGLAYKRGICGADLVGIDDMTYAKLARLLALAKDSKVTCIECMVES